MNATHSWRLPLILLGSLLLTPVTHAKEQPLDRIVALVNEDIILDSELSKNLKQAQSNLKRQGIDAKKIPGLQRQVLSQMIGETLQLQRAKQLGMRIDDRALNNQLNEIAQRNNLSLSQFSKMVEKQTGQRFVDYREDIRKQMLIDALQGRDVISRIQLSETQVDDALKNAGQAGRNLEYQLRHILISLPSNARKDAVQKALDKANTLVKQARNGADFAALAIANSESSTALEGGDIGWQNPASLPDQIAEKIRPLSAGQVSDPIQTPSGLHIFKVMQTRDKNAIIQQQTLARHILVAKKPERTHEASLARIRMIADQLNQGADFAELAKKYSDDPGSGLRGGDLGWLKPGETVAPFEQGMNKLVKGEVSDIIETQFGWHIIQVLDRRKLDVTDEARRAAIRKQLIDQKAKDEIEVWLKRLRENASIEMKL